MRNPKELEIQIYCSDRGQCPHLSSQKASGELSAGVLWAERQLWHPKGFAERMAGKFTALGQNLCRL